MKLVFRYIKYIPFKKREGFTLIELLVVISIISLLSSTIMVQVQDTRNKTKVSKVKADLVQIRNAAELYKTNTGNYPADFSNVSVLVPNYLPQVPVSPFGGSYAIVTEVYPNGYFCGKTFSNSEIETGRLLVYLSSGVNVPASGFDKFYGYFGVSQFYNGVTSNPVQPCID